jgi:hypothetical protein
MKTNQTNDNKVESWLSGAVRGKESWVLRGISTGDHMYITVTEVNSS